MEIQDKTAFHRLAEEFADIYRDSSVTTYILTQMNQEQFINAMHSIAYFLNLNKPRGSQYRNLPKDINSVLCLRLCSQVMHCLANDNQAEALAWTQHLALMVKLFIPNNDVHFRQIMEIMEYNIDTAKRNEKLQQEYEEQIKAVVTDLANGNVQPFVNLQEHPESFSALLRHLDEFDAYQWREGWKQDQVAYRFIHELHQFKSQKYTVWITIHNQIVQQNMTFPNNQRILLERQTGLAILNQD